MFHYYTTIIYYLFCPILNLQWCKNVSERVPLVMNNKPLIYYFIYTVVYVIKPCIITLIAKKSLLPLANLDTDISIVRGSIGPINMGFYYFVHISRRVLITVPYGSFLSKILNNLSEQRSFVTRPSSIVDIETSFSHIGPLSV